MLLVVGAYVHGASMDDEGSELAGLEIGVVVPQDVNFETTFEQDAWLAQEVAALEAKQQEIIKQLLLEQEFQEVLKNFNEEERRQFLLEKELQEALSKWTELATKSTV